jgi:2,3-bisphosphoglycerate-dependent phosphoglycerate mutase
MLRETTRICFVRHGETDWNIELRMQGHIDLALNANGEAQSLAVGHYFSASPHADALYCSDLLRARQTAQPIAQALGLPITLLPALRERNFGRCEGLVFKEIIARYEQDALAITTRNPDYVTPGGGESLRQHQRRVLDCIARIVVEHAGRDVVVVTHGGVLDIINRRVRGLSLEKPRDFEIHNAGVNWVAISGEQWVIESWGDTAHLS